MYLQIKATRTRRRYLLLEICCSQNLAKLGLGPEMSLLGRAMLFLLTFALRFPDVSFFFAAALNLKSPFTLFKSSVGHSLSANMSCSLCVLLWSICMTFLSFFTCLDRDR